MTRDPKPAAPLPDTADEVTRSTLLRVGAILLIVTATASALVWAGASAGCSGDGSFALSDPAARPNHFCSATHFAAFPPTSIASALLVAAILLTPSLVAVIGTVTAAVTRRPAQLRRSAVIAAVLVLLSTPAVFLGNVGYAGSG